MGKLYLSVFILFVLVTLFNSYTYIQYFSSGKIIAALTSVTVTFAFVGTLRNKRDKLNWLTYFLGEIGVIIDLLYIFVGIALSGYGTFNHSLLIIEWGMLPIGVILLLQLNKSRRALQPQ